MSQKGTLLHFQKSVQLQEVVAPGNVDMINITAGIMCFVGGDLNHTKIGTEGWEVDRVRQRPSFNQITSDIMSK